jgi:hypothetical protein
MSQRFTALYRVDLMKRHGTRRRTGAADAPKLRSGRHSLEFLLLERSFADALARSQEQLATSSIRVCANDCARIRIAATLLGSTAMQRVLVAEFAGNGDGAPVQRGRRRRVIRSGWSVGHTSSRRSEVEARPGSAPASLCPIS